MHIFGVLLPSISDTFVDISDYSMKKIPLNDVKIPLLKLPNMKFAYIYMYIRKDIEFIMVEYQNLVKLGFFFIMVYRSP